MTRVVGLMLMGARPEPYLSATLSSLAPAVDFLVVNDNGDGKDPTNRAVLEASVLFREGRMAVVEAPFTGFAQARNNCLQWVRERLGSEQARIRVGAPHRKAEDLWILMVDCDEIHGPGLATVTRRLLPALPERIGIVDGYFVQFMQCFDYFISLDRRHNLIFRHSPEVRWEKDVHEQLSGLHGSRLCLPYVYYHYGFVMANRHILSKWQHYQTLGDRSFARDELAGVETERMFDHEVPRCMPFAGGQPPALAAIRDALDAVADPSVDRFRELVAERLSHPAPRLLALLRRANYRLRVIWRAVQAMAAVPRPSLWAALLKLAL